MKNRFRINCFLISAVGSVLLSQSPLWAEEHMLSTNKLLELSLMSLKESYQKLQKENDVLISEIEFYNQRIGPLEEQVDRLKEVREEKKVSLPHSNLDIKQNDDQMTISSKQVENLRKELAELQAQYQNLGEKIKMIDRYNERFASDEKRLEGEIQAFQQNIGKYQKGIDDLARVSEDKFSSDFQGHNHKKSALEATLKDLKNFHQKPLAEIERLQQEQLSLKQNLVQTQESLRAATDHENQLSHQIDGIGMKTKDELSQLNDSLSKFQSKQKELDDVLSKARDKLSSEVSFANENYGDLDQMRHNISVIRDENLSLKKELTDLQGQLPVSSP